jgi:hypothetical protein
LGAFDFHHLGIATKSINEARHGFELLGYQEEASFSDDKQGVKGLFMTSKNQPRIELLENLSGSNVLNSWLKHSVAVYHSAYHVTSLDRALWLFEKLDFRRISSVKMSEYFNAPIVFMVLPNRFLIELIERS